MIEPEYITITFSGASSLSIDLLHALAMKEHKIVESNDFTASYDAIREKNYWVRCEMVVLEVIQKKIDMCISKMRQKRIREIRCKFTRTEIDVLVRNFPSGNLGLENFYPKSLWFENQKQLNNGR